MASSQKNLFSYMDYRAFLKEWYLEKKKRKETSLRSFSRMAGLTSPNYFKLIMDGDRNLTKKTILKFARALGLNKQEKKFFHHLVLFNQAASHAEKNKHYKAVLKSQKFNPVTPLHKKYYKYYSAWYHPVVRELVTFSGIGDSSETIAKIIFPQVSNYKIDQSLALLKSLNMIHQNESGRWQQTDSIVSTGPEPQSVTLMNYHKEVLDLAKNIISEVAKEQRDVSALTLGISKENVPVLKQMIQDFRGKVLQLVTHETSPQHVMTLTMQLLPATKGLL